MRLFEAVKVNVTASQAAAYCGFTPNRSKMICCPFHNDKHPSMKVDRRYYCFGCGEHGDAIDFVAKYYDLSLKDAAMKLADDFGIDYDRKIPASIEIKRAQIKQNQDRLQKEQIRDLCKELSELHSFLREKKQQPVTNGNFTILKSYIDDFEYVDYLYEHYILEASNQMRKQEYRVQMPKVTPHVCRHTFCSNMAKSGMNPKSLQYIMGHSDISVTLNTYTHVKFEDAQEEMRKIQAV